MATPAAGAAAAAAAPTATAPRSRTTAPSTAPRSRIYSPIRDAEADLLEESWAEFTDCTGIDISYEGSGEFEAQLNVRVEGGNAPDIAFFPQPGLLQRFAASGDLKPAPDQTESNVDEGWTEDWKAYGSVDGEFYGAPLGSNVKSFVWYSPSMFADAGYEVPETLDDLKALSDEIAGAGDVKPWCAGIESGDATGWPATDWMEDFMLRTAGPEVYDQWVNHEIPFNDPQVVEAADAVGRVPQEPGLRERWPGRRPVDHHHRVPGRRPADPRRPVLHAPAGVLLRRPAR